MSSTLQIDYVVLMYMVTGVFGLVGFFRGWWKEAFTAALLTFLLFLLKRPEKVDNVIGVLNQIVAVVLQLVGAVLMGTGMVEVQSQAESEPVLNPENYSTYVIVLIIFILLSYFLGKMGLTDRVSAGGRILGAGLGFYNGYLIISLMREFVLAPFLPGTVEQASDIAATSATPGNVQIQLTNLTPNSLLQPPTLYIMFAAGFFLFFIALFSGLKWDKYRVVRRPPPLYSQKGKKKKKDDSKKTEDKEKS